jgi:hypothetical protein
MGRLAWTQVLFCFICVERSVIIEVDRDPVEPGKRLQFDKIHPAFPGFTLVDERLRLIR